MTYKASAADVSIELRQEEGRGWVLLLRQGGREWQIVRSGD